MFKQPRWLDLWEGTDRFVIVGHNEVADSFIMFDQGRINERIKRPKTILFNPIATVRKMFDNIDSSIWLTSEAEYLGFTDANTLGRFRRHFVKMRFHCSPLVWASVEALLQPRPLKQDEKGQYSVAPGSIHGELAHIMATFDHHARTDA